MTDKRYTKVEEEIIQILDQMDQEPKPEPPTNLVAFRPRSQPKRQIPAKTRMKDFGVRRRVLQYSAGSWVGIGIVAALVAWQLSRFVPLLGFVAMLVSVGAFVAALYAKKSGPSASIPGSSSTTKRWRGRDIDLSEPRHRPGFNRDKKWGKGRFRGPRN
jgi:hypothetical protein